MTVTILDQTTYRDILNNAQQAVLIVFKKLCPHCRNMEKVLEKFTATHAEVLIYGLDIEEYPEAAADLGASRAPTLLVIKNGEIRAVKTGLMNPREFKTFFEKA